MTLVQRVTLAIRSAVRSERAIALDDETDQGWARIAEEAVRVVREHDKEQKDAMSGRDVLPVAAVLAVGRWFEGDRDPDGEVRTLCDSHEHLRADVQRIGQELAKANEGAKVWEERAQEDHRQVERLTRERNFWRSRRRSEVMIASVNDGGLQLELHRREDAIELTGGIGGITWVVHSPSSGTHPFLLIGLGCGLKEDERFRPLYQALQRVIDGEEGKP